MSDDPTQNEPLPLAEVLAEELRSFGCEVPAANPQATDAERLREVQRLIRTLQPERSALCLSGGGIRSATFSLGVVQALAKAGLLEKFDYLSTVSGGGYLGSMLTAWIHHHSEGLSGVAAELAGDCAHGSTAPGAAPLRHLRRFSNYIAPRLGLFSADGWTLAATAVRNLLLNWTVLVLLLAAVVVVPWLGVLGVMAQPKPWELHAMLAAAFLAFAAATAYPGWDLPSLENFRWPQKLFLAGWLAPMLIGTLCLASWWAGLTNTNYRALVWMASSAGKWSVFGFLVTSCLAGVLACSGTVLVRDRRRGKKTFTRANMKNLAVISVAAVLVVGLPGAALLWLVALKLFPGPSCEAVADLTFAPAVFLLGFFLLNSLYVGVTSRASDDDDREWWARAAGWVGAVVTGWLVVHGLVFWLPMYLPRVGVKLETLIAASGGVLGFIGAKIAAGTKTPAFLEDKPELRKLLFASAAAVLFFALLSYGVSRLVLDQFVQVIPASYLGDLKDWEAHSKFDRLSLILISSDLYAPFASLVFLVLGVLVGIGLAMGFFINVNRFSLHATYRNRLVRAYLGAARARQRQPHPFTGFDPADNFDFAEIQHPRPLHVINMALNLVTGDELAWQERKADSFTATRLHCGNRRLGYRACKDYADGMSLGTALAISGAAASPNEGYNSSPLLTFLMTLFNVRLGWWLGNPGRAGRRTWRQNGPVQAAFPLFIEALGLTSDRRAYVNLSDGGHFENLAIYEMLVRRCRFLVVVDAEQDEAYRFEGLGGAIRKARVDFGIQIVMHDLDAVSKDADAARRSYFAIGEIDYRACDPSAENGLLLYLKPVLKGGEPTDVRHYATTDETFPHEKTVDQFFSESQFESYRALGCHAMTCILASLTAPVASPAALIAQLVQNRKATVGS